MRLLIFAIITVAVALVQDGPDIMMFENDILFCPPNDWSNTIRSQYYEEGDEFYLSNEWVEIARSRNIPDPDDVFTIMYIYYDKCDKAIKFGASNANGGILWHLDARDETILPDPSRRHISLY
jgi:hypothetical protein